MIHKLQKPPLGRIRLFRVLVMKRILNRRAQQIIIGLTLFWFVLGYLLMVKVGISDVKDFLGFLAASYLIVWGGYSLLSPFSRDEIRVQFVLMTISLGVALFFAEVPAWFEFIDYRKIFSISGGSLWDQPGHQPDVELLAKHEPHHSVRMLFSRGNLGDSLCLPARPAEPFEVRYDQNGFRNDQDLVSAEIAVIGDSYIESEMFPSSVIATTRLAATTHKTVANLGQSGYGPQQELAVLKRYALPLRPEHVVWVFYEGNDLLDTLKYEEMITLLRHKLNSMEMVWDRSFTKNSLSWLMRLVQGCTPAPRIPAVPATIADNEGAEHRVYVKGRSSSVSLTKEDLDALKKSVATIEEAYRLVQQEGARLIVVFAPTALRVYQGIARFERSPPWVLDDLSDRLRKMISEISPDIGYLDLTPVLKSTARNNKQIFLSDDTHWSAEGHEVVAKAIAGAITDATKISAERESPEMQNRKQDKILSRDAIMIRNADGTIRYWSKGAQQLYGWEPKDTLGMTSHRLLETVFPVPLEVIEEELRVKGYWEGQLIHKRRDGSRITVSSHWDVQQNPLSPDQSITVVEVNDSSKS
jgi:PAS domain-containing protein